MSAGRTVQLFLKCVGWWLIESWIKQWIQLSTIFSSAPYTQVAVERRGPGPSVEWYHQVWDGQLFRNGTFPSKGKFRELSVHLWLWGKVVCFFLFPGDSFSQFRFAEEKEWDGEASCPKQVRWSFVLNVCWLFSRVKTSIFCTVV